MVFVAKIIQLFLVVSRKKIYICYIFLLFYYYTELYPKPPHA